MMMKYTFEFDFVAIFRVIICRFISIFSIDTSLFCLERLRLVFQNVAHF